MAHSISQAAATAMLQALFTIIDSGTAAVIDIYSGTPPANVDAALSGNTKLAQLVCSTTAVSGYSDTGSAARATFAAIASDTSADATGVATFYRISPQNAATPVTQGEVATSGKELNLNTTSITSGSTVAINSATMDQPEGP